MRKLALLVLTGAIFYSCATPGEESPAETPPVSEQPAVTVSEPPSTGESAPAESGEAAVATPQGEPAPEEEPVVEPQPPALVLTEPQDLSTLTRTEFFIAARLDPGDGGLPVAVEVELLSGPIVDAAFTVADASALPEEERIRRVPLSDLRAAGALGAEADSGNETISTSELPPEESLRAAALVSLPNGFVDEERYSWRVRGSLADGSATPWTNPIETRVSLDLDPPVISPQSATIDTTPPIAWMANEMFRAYRIRLSDAAGTLVSESVSRGNRTVIDAALLPGRYSIGISGLTVAGFATRFSDPIRLRVLADAAPRPAWPVAGDETLGPAVGLHWTPVTGAASYVPEYRSVGGEWITLDDVSDPFTPIPADLVPGESYEWRVRAVDENGTMFSWSEEAQFLVGGFTPRYVPIVSPGDAVSFLRGYEGGSRDERPVARITLTVPFEMSVTPLTNADVAELVNYAILHEFVTADREGVYLRGPDGAAGDPLLGLETMDYGQQFGLRYADGRVDVRPGYEAHPAVGVTWKGAIGLANFISFVEGRTPAYDLETGEWDREADGYRLPTEAEWEYAARGATDRLYPWGGSLTGRVANYYRSFDPFEDVNEPFDRSGGPTTPVDFFNGTAREGFQTISGASPFGVLDLVGNTWEWCWDRYDAEYYADAETTNPAGPEKGDVQVENAVVVLAATLDPNQRVVRGTAWNSRAPDVRLTNRGRYTELGRSYSIGVRLIRPPVE